MELDSGRLWYLPELPELELLAGRYQRQVFPWHAHDTYCISLQEAGTETIAFADGVRLVRPGTILVVPPGEAHATYGLGRQEWQLRSFYVPAGLLRSVAGPSTGPPRFPARLLTDPPLFAALRRVHQRLATEGFSPPAQRQLEQGLAALVAAHGRPGTGAAPSAPPLARLPQVLALLAEQLPHKLTVGDLAAEAGLSRFHFTRRFAQATGLTPVAYLTQQRVARAKQLLRAGATPVAAALDAGFFDQSHFARCFKRLVGTTPGHYRTIVQS